MSESITIEVCVETVTGAVAAEAAGADRLELCAGLAVGGLTPGPGLIAATLEAVRIPVVVLCRPRRGDFLYGDGERRALAADVDAARRAGASGVALGVLTPQGTIDRPQTSDLIGRAGGMQVCFHRAFDLVRDQDEALEALVELGVQRILTSGGEPDVVQGLDRLAHLNARAAGRITILPGGGVTEHNARALVDTTRVVELHLSAGCTVESGMLHRREVALGAAALPGEYDLRATDPDRIRALRARFEG
ncbi:MAG: copper homeostasis protein CutC [Planctomycetota bacterium]|nr:copper homeostasis protein CutC [Planctomycetota bacterium]